MKILHVIHGYPSRYNAGSELYTQSLAREQSKRHEVHVFTRLEDPFRPAFGLLRMADSDVPAITLHLVNNPHSRDRYRQARIDQRFAEVLGQVRPDIVHIGHLNHLSTSLVTEIPRSVPIVFTLHDYWLMCPRGQFLQMQPPDDSIWPLCDGQEDRKCAERCYARNFSGDAADHEHDVAHWERWVNARMKHVREIAERVDLFLAPSQHLLSKFRDEFGLPAQKLRYLDYGFDRARLVNRTRAPEDGFVFGYIGTHTPAKGIHTLIEAFTRLRGAAKLRIWGRPRDSTPALRELAARLPGNVGARIEWRPEYENERLVEDVFNHVDAIVVPSIWEENSPLVIHEAQQARVPVLTADAGGMAEYVRDGENGFLFSHRDSGSITAAMERCLEDRDAAARVGSRGYALSRSGDIPSIGSHALEIERLYGGLLREKTCSTTAGPWRITFDTNPDDCNLACIMCEEHSPLSTRQREREATGIPPRRMGIDLIRRVLSEARGSALREVIPSTMGEPLLYEHFDEVIDLCVAGGFFLNVTTNGTFPRRGARGWAERLVPVTSDIKISWNGATAATQEEIMLGARMDRMIRGVEEFIEVRDAHAAAGGNRCRVTFQLTFLESNVAEIPEIIRLAARLGVDRVKGHHLWAHFVEIKSLSMRRSPDSARAWNEIVRAAGDAADRHLLPDGRRILLENFALLDEVSAPKEIAQGAPCPFLGKEAWISAEGRFNPCCAPDDLRKTLGEFGNAGRTPLLTIWNGSDYQKLRASYMDHAVCRGCNMRKHEVAP